MSGEIIPELSACTALTELVVERNFFHGSIPSFLGSLMSLEILDPSNNNLSGVIPGELQNLSFLNTLNLSFNHLYGEVPIGSVFNNITEISLIGNKTLRKNLNIWTFCSSVDCNGDDFKAIVFEFMPHGSLDSLLHSSKELESGNFNLTLQLVLNIALDVANALDYLHHGSEQAVVHCDIKPSNILLDDDFVAQLGDFGLAKTP